MYPSSCVWHHFGWHWRTRGRIVLTRTDRLSGGRTDGLLTQMVVQPTARNHKPLRRVVTCLLFVKLSQLENELTVHTTASSGGDLLDSIATHHAAQQHDGRFWLEEYSDFSESVLHQHATTRGYADSNNRKRHQKVPWPK